MKFVQRLTEALRNIPKDLPGEDEWGQEIGLHMLAVAIPGRIISQSGISAPELDGGEWDKIGNAILSIRNIVNREFHGLLDEGEFMPAHDRVDIIDHPENIRSFSMDGYIDEFVDWIKYKLAEDKIIFSFRIWTRGHVQDFSKEFDRGGLSFKVVKAPDYD